MQAGQECPAYPGEWIGGVFEPRLYEKAKKRIGVGADPTSLAPLSFSP